MILEVLMPYCTIWVLTKVESAKRIGEILLLMITQVRQRLLPHCGLYPSCVGNVSTNPRDKLSQQTIHDNDVVKLLVHAD
jgi:hypothetical protein